MTDVEKFRALMADFGVPLEEEIDERGATSLTIRTPRATDDTTKVVGYPMFETTWAFTPDGKFASVGLWE